MLLLIFSIVQYNCERPHPPSFSRKYTGDCHLPPEMCNLQSPFPPIRARWALPSSLRIHDLFISICGSFKQNTNCYMFRLDMQRIVYATRIGCMARFLNHCCGVPSPLSLRHGNNFSLVTFRNSNCQLYHTLSLPQRKCRDLQTPQSCGPDLTH
jgi:hypothetical protein